MFFLRKQVSYSSAWCVLCGVLSTPHLIKNSGKQYTTVSTVSNDVTNCKPELPFPFLEHLVLSGESDKSSSSIFLCYKPISYFLFCKIKCYRCFGPFEPQTTVHRGTEVEYSTKALSVWLPFATKQFS